MRLGDKFWGRLVTVLLEQHLELSISTIFIIDLSIPTYWGYPFPYTTDFLEFQRRRFEVNHISLVETPQSQLFQDVRVLILPQLQVCTVDHHDAAVAKLGWSNHACSSFKTFTT